MTNKLPEGEYNNPEYESRVQALALEARKQLFEKGHQNRYGDDAHNLKASLEAEQRGEIQPIGTPTPPEGDRSN